MKQICPFCGEEKDTRHQALCPKNPNKRVLKSKLSNGYPDKVVPAGEMLDILKPKPAPLSGEKSIIEVEKRTQRMLWVILFIQIITCSILGAILYASR